MEIKKGIPVSPGYGAGPAFILDSEEAVILKRFITEEDVYDELDRLATSTAASFRELEQIKREVTGEIGDEFALIFDFQIKMLQDENLQNEVRNYIKKDKYSAEYAVSRTLRRYINMFRRSGNQLLEERVQDIRDFRSRLLRNLRGDKKLESINGLQQDVIIIAKDLTPSQTAQLNREKVIGFATDAGGRTSHAAIVARALGIPAVVGLEDITNQVSGGDSVIIDGVNGFVIVNPTEETEKKYGRLSEEYDSIEAALRGEAAHLASETMDGFKIKLRANIEFPEEIEIANSYGAEGVGLYRTEFMYTYGDGDPSEEQQFSVYKEVVEKAGRHPVIMRTWDLGADKFHAESVAAPEANPFLGCRSIRFSFLRVDHFKKQLRAILRSSMYGNVRIMLPLVTSLEEITRAREIIRDTMDELERESIPFKKDIPVGVMVEVPSAAIASDLLAREADFFSIGTNDLVQYTLAVDRGNERVSGLYQPSHPAVVRLLKDIVDNAKRADIPVALCGEMSSDIVYIPLLLGVGLRELSVTPTSIPEVKKAIRSLTVRQSVDIARTVFSMDRASEIDEYLKKTARELLPRTLFV